MVNPRQIRDFARATRRLAKTDALNAQVIALFAERLRPAPRPVADADSQNLAELIARRRQVIEMAGMKEAASCRRNPLRLGKVAGVSANVTREKAEARPLPAIFDIAFRLNNVRRFSAPPAKRH